MRKALRAGGAVVLAYLIQATVLPYLKVRGVQLDLMTITLFSLGSVLGMYKGICCGLFAALIMESVGGDIAGFTTVFCLGAAAFGAYTVKKIEKIDLPGNRGRERMIRLVAPKAAAGLFMLGKESLYFTYFFLTGVSMAYIHVFRIIFSAVEVAAFSFVLMPLLKWWIEHPTRTRAEKKAERLARKKKFEPPAAETQEEPKEKKKKKKRSFFDDLRVLDEDPTEEETETAQPAEEEGLFEGWRLARADEEDEEIPEKEEKDIEEEAGEEVRRIDDEG